MGCHLGVLDHAELEGVAGEERPQIRLNRAPHALEHLQACLSRSQGLGIKEAGSTCIRMIGGACYITSTCRAKLGFRGLACTFGLGIIPVDL